MDTVIFGQGLIKYYLLQQRDIWELALQNIWGLIKAQEQYNCLKRIKRTPFQEIHSTLHLLKVTSVLHSFKWKV